MQPPLPSLTPTWHNASYPAISSSRPELSAAGKTVIVTGAGSGIGRATVLSFARAGASKIILIGRTETKLQETQRLLAATTTSAHIHACDVADAKRMAEVARAVGTWDILVLVAEYISTPGGIGDHSVGEWWRSIETNLKGSLVPFKALLSTANPSHAAVIGYSAAITFPASVGQGLSSYAISKLSIVKLIEYIAEENPTIFAAALHPGIVETDILKQTGADPAALPLDSANQCLVDLSGDFAVWLVSEEAAFLNGRYVWANWDVDELRSKSSEIQAGQLLRAGIAGWPFI
ncbi:putative NADP(+)-dependent dehydrogenase [Aspergillus venezuelensis]